MNIGFTGYAGNNSVAATSFTFSIGSDIYSPTYSTLSIIGVAYDNSDAAGAGPIISSIVDGKSTWTQSLSVVRDPSTANNGVILGVWRSNPTQSVPAGTAFTVTFGAAVQNKAWVLYTFTNYDNVRLEVASYSVVSGALGAGNPYNITLNGFIENEVGFGIGSIEESAAVFGSTGATGGTWSSVIGAAAGIGTNGVRVFSQVKIMTSSNNQVWTPSTGGVSYDAAGAFLRINDGVVGGFDPFGMLGIYGI